MNIRIIWRLMDKYICVSILIILSLSHRIVRLVRLNKTLEIQDVKKILIIKLAALGDTILVIPILRAIRTKFPESKIVMVVTDINSGAVENCPYIDRLKFFDINKQIKNPFLFLRFIQVLRKEKFDIIFDFEQRIRISALITHFIKAKRTFGFKTKGYLRHYLYTDVIVHKKDQHEFECCCDLVEDITGEVINRKLEFWIPDRDHIWANVYLKDILGKKKIIVLHPGCGGSLNKGWKAREWPKDYYVELINKLYSSNLQFIISGGKSEVALAQYITSRSKSKVLITAGKIDISKLAAILKLSKLLISGDTGIMHLAAAVGINTIAIFGPSDPRRWRPLSINNKVISTNFKCAPCQYFGVDNPKCNDFECMRKINPDDVFRVVARVIQK